MTGKAPGGTSRKSGGFWRKFPEGCPDFLEVALVRKYPDGILPRQTSKKFASEPPELLRSPSRSGSKVKLVLALSYGNGPNTVSERMASIGCTPRGSCNRTLLRRALRRFSNSKCFLEGFLEGTCKGFQ